MNKREIDEPLEWFKQQMKAKLRKNDFKGGWENKTIKQLLHRLNEESIELFNAIRHEPLENIIKEAADVANFAMMIADLARKKGDNV